MNLPRNMLTLFALLATASALAAPEPDQRMIDKRFGEIGRVIVPIDHAGGNFDDAFAIGTQSDGRIVVAGTIDVGGGRKGIGVTRRLASGAYDASFGNFGLRVIDFGAGISAGANALVIQPDDRIVVAGWRNDGGGGGNDYLVLRLLANGFNFDHSFGSSGVHIQSWNLGNDNSDVATSVALQADGKIVVAGTLQRVSTTDRDVGVMRLNPDGSLDTGFGIAGRRTIAPDLGGGDDDRANAIALQGDGKIVIGGSATTASHGVDMLAVRLLANGSLDLGFGSNGIGHYHLPTGLCSDDFAMAIRPVSWGLIPAQRRILLAGATCYDVSEGRNDWDFAVVRLLENGQLDTTLNDVGWRRVGLDLGGGNRDIARAVAVWREDRFNLGFLAPPTHITLAGFALDTRVPGDRGYQFAFAQLNWEGSRDTRFGDNGQGYVDFDLGLDNNDFANAMVLTARGEAIAAGTVRLPSGVDHDFALTRIVLDRIFAGDQEND